MANGYLVEIKSRSLSLTSAYTNINCCVFKFFSPGGGVLPYKSDGAARRKFSRTPLNGTRILFYGSIPNSFPSLRGTNSKLYNWHLQILIVIKITFEPFLFKELWKVLSKIFILIKRIISGSGYLRF